MPRPDRLRIALFGASTKGRACLRALGRRTDVHVQCFLDNDPAVWGSEVDGIPVRAPGASTCAGLSAIVISSLHVDAIFHQLARLGFADRTAVSLADFDARFQPTPAASARLAPLSPPASARQAPHEGGWVARQLAALNGVIGSGPVERSTSSVELALCTVVSNNYLAYARTVASSFLRHHPGGRVFVCLVDEKIPGVTYPDAVDSRIHVIEARDLGLARFESMAFGYTAVELNTAVKPAFFKHVFDRFAVERLVFLDPDIVVFRPLTPIAAQLTRHAIALVPHLTSRLDDGRSPGEIDILKAGVFNLGFLGLSRGPETSRFLDWWGDRLERHCVIEPERSLFVDQRWVDLVPALFDDYVILKDPGYDVAYWNLHERDVTLEDGDVRVNGQPLYFYHYSGIDVDDIDQVSRYQNRVHLPGSGALRSLFELYRELLARHGHAQTRALPYRYAAFENAVPVSDAIRRVYRSSPALADRFANPFVASGNSFLQWLKEPVAPGSRVTNLFAGLHATRNELRFAFPDPRGADAAALVERLMSTSSTLYGVHPAFFDHKDSSCEPTTCPTIRLNRPSMPR